MLLTLQINFTILNQIYQNLKKEKTEFADCFYYKDNKNNSLRNLKKKNEGEDNNSITSIRENQYTKIIQGEIVKLNKDTKSILSPYNFNNKNFFIAPNLTKLKLKNSDHPKKTYFSDEDWKQFFADRKKQPNKKIFSQSAGDNPITCAIFHELEQLDSNHIEKEYSNDDIILILDFFKNGPKNRKIYDDCEKTLNSMIEFYHTYSREELNLLCKEHPSLIDKYKRFLGGFSASLIAAQFENREKKK